MTRIYQWLKRLFVVESYDDLENVDLTGLQQAYNRSLQQRIRFRYTNNWQQMKMTPEGIETSSSSHPQPVLSTPWLRSPNISGKHENWSLGNEAEFIWPHRPSLRRPFNWRFHA